MLKQTTSLIWKWARRIVTIVAIICVTIVLVWAFQSRTLPDLEVWHDPLNLELDAGDLGNDMSFEQLLEAEAKLFEQMDSEVYRTDTKMQA